MDQRWRGTLAFNKLVSAFLMVPFIGVSERNAFINSAFPSDLTRDQAITLPSEKAFKAHQDFITLWECGMQLGRS